MKDWEAYPARAGVTGDLRLLKYFYSPQLKNRRKLLVWLPPSYEQSGRRYPVLYMHDGQNLFDRRTSYAGEWQVDETMTRLSAEGLEAIIVGLPNIGPVRLFEYNPYADGRGEAYLHFIIETVMPRINRDFRTQTAPESTGLGGSSMGGLISLYGLLAYPQVFGLCASFSPAFWFGGSGLEQTIAERTGGQGRIYLDGGGREGATFENLPEPWRTRVKEPDRAYLLGVRKLSELLVEHGYQAGRSLLYVEEELGQHNEAAWARRLPMALRFLLSK